MSSSILLNATRNTKEEERNKYFSDNGVKLRPIDHSRDLESSSIDNPRRQKKVRLDVEDDEHAHPNNSNNLAKMLFGNKNRGEAIRKQRTSVEKEKLEQAMGSKKLPSRSEERKQRPPPTVTVVSKINTKLTPLEEDSIKSVRKSNVTVTNPMNFERYGGIVAIPSLTATYESTSSVRKNIIRTKIVNKVDDILNKELVRQL